MIVVLVALGVEYSAVRDRLTDLRIDRHAAGTLFELGSVPRNGRTAHGTEVALALVGKGNTAAATLAERAINSYRPAALMFVGVAGGLRDWLRLGDVVMATKVYGYQGGHSDATGFRAYPRAWETSHEVEQIARHLERDGKWATGLASPPRVHFEPIAAGDVVVNSRQTPEAQRLHEIYADAVAIEMEGAGVAHAGHVNKAVPTAIVRGISDLADGHKSTADAEGWQLVAAAHAATFALALATVLEGPTADKARPAPDDPTPGPGATNTSTVVAADNACVGQQFGSVGGNSTFHNHMPDSNSRA